MAQGSARLPLVFSCLGHAYMHLFTAFYFVIVLALEDAWTLPYHELIELWTLGALPAEISRRSPQSDLPTYCHQIHSCLRHQV